MNQTVKGVLYVSVWVVLWGTAASIADFVLLEREAYASGSSGQAITFVSYGIATVVLAVRLAARFLAPAAAAESSENTNQENSNQENSD